MNEIIESTPEHNITYKVLDTIVVVEHLNVEPKYRRKGIGTKVLLELRQRYDKPLFLLCWETLIPFYEKVGFINEGQTVNEYYEMILK